jgi:hypothetical protein
MPDMHEGVVRGRRVQSQLHSDQLLLSVSVRQLRDEDFAAVQVRRKLQERRVHLLVLQEHFEDGDGSVVRRQQATV